MDAFKKIITSLILGIFFIFISGCMNVAMTGAQAVYGRHNIKKSLEDSTITLKAEREIYIKRTRFKDTHVSISTFNNIVLLVGQVDTPQQKNAIEHIVRDIDGVNEIHNLIAVAKPVSSLIRLSDTWITAKIKTKLIAANEIDPSQIKVVTENGIVYLMGVISPEQANVAVELARTTDGVQSVVKVFSYLHISKT